MPSNGVSDSSDEAADIEIVTAQPGIVLRRREALEGQAITAVMVFAGFYVLALLTVIMLVLTPFLVIGTLGIFSPYIVLSCYGLALLILAAIVPRPDRFIPPGPRVDATGQPRLFKVISEVAARTGQEMPSEVYLIAGVNAFVTQRGGIMGLGSRRVMGVGLGILQALKAPEFKSVMAHEFGHFYDGHLKLGPWIYQSRMAMTRAVESMEEWNSWLYGPYSYYTLLFLRVTLKISRTQEFIADELAARLYGARLTAGSITMVHAASTVFDSYWRDEIAPRVRAGYRPAVVEGFAHLLRREYEGAAVPQNATRETERSKTGAYDSHPSLAERLGALKALRAGGEGGEPEDVDDRPAISLLDGVNELEGLVLQNMYGQSTARALKPVTWEPLDREMSLADYEELVRQHSRALKGVTPLSLIRLCGNMEQYSTTMVPTPDLLRKSDLYFVSDLATKTLSASMTLALRQAGWQVQLLPGGNIICTRGEETFEPFKVVQRMCTGHMNSDALKRQYVEAGIAEIDLGTVATLGVGGRGSGIGPWQKEYYGR
jgi:heat shock protein HtpX